MSPGSPSLFVDQPQTHVATSQSPQIQDHRAERLRVPRRRRQATHVDTGKLQEHLAAGGIKQLHPRGLERPRRQQEPRPRRGNRERFARQRPRRAVAESVLVGPDPMPPHMPALHRRPPRDDRVAQHGLPDKRRALRLPVPQVARLEIQVQLTAITTERQRPISR